MELLFDRDSKCIETVQTQSKFKLFGALYGEALRHSLLRASENQPDRHQYEVTST